MRFFRMMSAAVCVASMVCVSCGPKPIKSSASNTEYRRAGAGTADGAGGTASMDKQLAETVRQMLKVKDHEKSETFADLSDADFEYAEARLGIQFPRSYRDLHERVKGVEFKQWDLYRVYTKGAREKSVKDGMPVWGPDDHTLDERRTHKRLFPNYLVAIANDGLGNLVCFDTRKHTVGDEYRIVSWEHDVVLERDFDLDDMDDVGLQELGRTVQEWLAYELEVGGEGW